MTDIAALVERLRNRRVYETPGVGYGVTDPLCKEAADALEALQVELSDARWDADKAEAEIERLQRLRIFRGPGL